MGFKLSSDEATNQLFDRAVLVLQRDFSYSQEIAHEMASAYYVNFQDCNYCAKLDIPVQNEDFFHYESADEVALRIHYYLGIKGDPNPVEYIRWRMKYYKTKYNLSK